MVTWCDIASFIVSFVSLVATIAVSFIILHLDRKHEKHKEAEQEKIRSINLEHEADVFLLKNNEEIQFLPLCVIANNLYPTKQHRREIYNNFNLCSDELKSIILKKYNINIKSIPSNDWFGL